MPTMWAARRRPQSATSMRSRRPRARSPCSAPGLAVPRRPCVADRAQRGSEHVAAPSRRLHGAVSRRAVGEQAARSSVLAGSPSTALCEARRALARRSARPRADRGSSADSGSSFGSERQQGEGRQPMLAHIIARDVRQAGVEMGVGGVARKRGEVGIERAGEAAPAPGAAEIDPVEMGDLAVRAVGDEGGREQARRRAGGEIGQEGVEPGAERAGSGSARRISSASVSAGERKSSPPGSQPGQARSAP